MNIHWLVPMLFAIASLEVQAPLSRAQPTIASSASSFAIGDSPSPTIRPPQLDLLYTLPTEKIRSRAYLFDAYVPYPIAGTANVAGGNHADNTPPQGGHRASAFGLRFRANLAIATVTTTTHYGLAGSCCEATVFYRCECKGFFPRFGQAMLSTMTAPRGKYGRRRLSFPAIVAPYAGIMTAFYGRHSARNGPQNALGMGNDNLVALPEKTSLWKFSVAGRTRFSAGFIARDFRDWSDPSSRNTKPAW